MLKIQLSRSEREYVDKALVYVNAQGRAAADVGNLSHAAAMSLVKHHIELLNDGEDVSYAVVQYILAIGEYSGL